jgi:hypothetical protein
MNLKYDKALHIGIERLGEIEIGKREVLNLITNLPSSLWNNIF